MLNLIIMIICKPKISVIVPVYNVEYYLPRCIESVLAQSYTNFELLLIDDGSSDRSGVICDQYAKKDDRIRVFHQKNGGVTSARALGVNQSCSDGYVTFVDSDDELPVKALEIYAECCSDKYDIIIGKIDNKRFLEPELTKEDYRSYTIIGNVLHSGPWARLFKRSLFDDWVFDIPREIVYAEDYLMNIRLAFKNQKSVKLLSKKIYNYTSDNNSSVMHSFYPTIEYEEMFSKYRSLSIPTEFRDLYTKEVIESKVSGILQIMDRTRQGYRKYQYVENLISEIKKNNIHIPLSRKLRLETRNDYVLKCVFFLIDLKKNLMKRKYRQ